MAWRVAGTARTGILAGIFGIGFLLLRVGTSRAELGTLPEWAPAVAGILSSGLLAGCVWLGFRWGESRSVALFALTLPLVLLSGEAGGAGGWGSWLSQFGLTPEMIEPTIWAIRKTVHVTFYGALAWLGMRSVSVQPNVAGWKLWVGAAGWALCFALYDETRQMSSAGRSGSMSDVGVDLAGVLLFGGIFYWKWKRAWPEL